MTKLSEAGINKLIDRYKKSYIDNPSFLLSGYSQENQTVADYEGRQLLELMQNADDAKSDIVYISLDTDKQELTVSNNGEPFSLDGVESLMYTGLSTKNKIEYIGNKGLGFRSILSWVNWVEVRTRDVSFRFSKTYAEIFFKKYLLGNLLIEERIEKEKAEKRLNTDEIPIATLAFPDLLTDKETEFTTSVVLQFKEEELKYIEEQIAVISEETLLFLPNIREIKVVKDGEFVKSLRKDVDEEHLITINNKTWNIYRKPDQVYENVKYNYAIVWQDDLTNTGHFYNYFPTDVETNLPCIIHATFDLTNNRKEINKTAANKYILDCIVDSIGNIVSKHLRYETPNWDAYQFLNPMFDNNRTFFKPFYNEILGKREEIGCYPTLDVNYVEKGDAFYHTEEFSEWVLRNKLSPYFPNLLLPTREVNVCTDGSKHYSASELLSIIKKINYLITSHRERAVLIKILLDKSFVKLQDSTTTLPLLIGEDYNYKEGSYDEVVSALENTDKHYKTPDFIPITFIDKELKRELLTVFSKEIRDSREFSDSKKDAEDPSRTLKRIIKSVVNLGSNDITEVIRYIVQEVKDKYLTPKAIINLMDSLWFIYQKNPVRGNKITVDVPLLNRNGEVAFASSLFFGKDYEKGTLTEKLFKDIYTDNQYLLNSEGYNLLAIDNLSFQSFFEWIGVNHLVVFSKEALKYKSLSEYYDFLFIKKQINKPDNANKNNITLNNFKAIKNNKDLKVMDLNNLLILLEKSSAIKYAVNQTIEIKEKLEFKYGNFKPKAIETPYSYLYSQISELVNFSEYTLSEDKDYHTLFKFINLKDNYITDILTSLEIDSLKVTLKNLGVSETLNDVTQERIAFLLNNQEGYFPQGKGSQDFYKKCLDYYLLKKDEFNSSLLKNCASFYGRVGTKNKALKLYDKGNLFYSDNILLPQKFLNNFNFINLPKRVGEDNVKDIFGVNLIKDELNKIELINPKEEENSTKEITDYINKLKPYFLCYRLEQIKKSRKTEADLIKPLQLKIMSHLEYRYNDTTVSFNDNEFLPHKDFYYIKRKNQSHLESLIKDPNFCDVIAEIICMVFKVSNLKNTFRRVFKDGIQESNHILKSDDKLGLLEEAKKLLGISDDEKSFWAKILKRDLNAIEDADLLKEVTENDLGIAFPVYYSQVDFAALGNSQGVPFLKWLKSIKQFDLNRVLKAGDLTNYHQENIEELIRDIESTFKKLLWTKANDSTNLKDKKEFFKRLTALEPVFEKGTFKQFLKDNQYHLEPNYKAAVFDYVLADFVIDLKKIPDPTILIETKYKTLFKSYTFGIDVEDMEKIIKETTPEIYSYLYFEGFEEEIKKALELQQADKVKDSQDTDNGIDTSNLSLIESDMQRVEPLGTGNPSRNGGSHNSKGDRKKAIAGKREEDKVVNSLKQNGYQVRHVSKTTDRKHYDIEYKKTNEAWRFLEVKKDSGGYFFMSKHEKETALSDKAREKYDIAIVNQNNIHIIKNPFNFKGEETFEINSKFYAESTEFKIHFEVNSKDNLDS